MKQGVYIRNLLKEKKVRLGDVAKRMGIAQPTLSNKLSGRGNRTLKAHEIQILLEMLDMTYEEVFKTKETKIINNDEQVITIGSEKFVVPEEKAQQFIKLLDKDVKILTELLKEKGVS
jgi:transcriptional regulator with XRE-family HTH domain